VRYCLVLLLFCTACTVHYDYEHIAKDGSYCSLSISSTRELDAGAVSITKNCELIGKGTGMMYNDEALTPVNKLLDAAKAYVKVLP